MTSKLDQFNQTVIKGTKRQIPNIGPGHTVRVYQKIMEAGKERLQPFEGLVIAVKHGRGLNGTFTVRKIASGVGVERIYPFFSPNVAKIDILKKAKVRRSKLYYMRERFGRAARMKNLEIPGEETVVMEQETEDLQESPDKKEEEIKKKESEKPDQPKKKKESTDRPKDKDSKQEKQEKDS